MPLLTDAQLRAELQKCHSCEARPCRAGCPAGVSPADFILAARGGEPSDLRRAAAHILAQNPLGGVCGSVCPDSLCMARCSRRALDAPVNIPALQGAIVAGARALGPLPRVTPAPATGLRVAVVGAGPAGLGAASVLAKAGHAVHVLDRSRQAGGMARLIPGHRLDPEVLEADLAGLRGLGDLRFVLGRPVPLPRDLLARGFAAVVVASGLGEPVGLDVPGGRRALPWTELLGPRPPSLRGRRVAVIGDGAVALDCAEAALARGAAHVELFALRALSELELTRRERARLLGSGVHLSFRVRVTAIRGRGDGRKARVSGLALHKVELPAGEAFHPSRLVDLPHGEHERRDLDAVILAIGGRAGLRREPHPRIVYAGDLESGPTSVVEALASGKRAALAVLGLLSGDPLAACPDRATCPGGSGCPRAATCPEWNAPSPGSRPGDAPRAISGLPVALTTELYGRTLRSPFLLAPGPFTAGAAQVRRGYAAGWAGAMLRVPPGEAADGALARLCAGLARLRDDFPDRLTLVALGDEADPSARQAIEATGAVVVNDAQVGDSDGGPMDYREAAGRIARGAKSVLFGDLVAKAGLGIVNELHAGLSWFLAERGLRSVSELAGAALAQPAAPPAVKASLRVDAALCTGCGNCSRCPEGAVAFDARGIPVVDPALCTGCALCVEPCFTGAITVGRAD